MLKDTPRSRMWENCLSGSERGWGTTMTKKIKHRPKSLESPSYSNSTNPDNFCRAGMVKDLPAAEPFVKIRVIRGQ